MFSDAKKSYNNALLDKIESFIKKFYLNKLIQGCLIGSALLITSFLIINAIEYFSWSSSKIRLILLITLITLFSVVACFYYIIPLVNLVRFRKKMTNEQAAILIGKFFPEIKDKLLNTLQLANEANNNSDNELLLATIEERTKNLEKMGYRVLRFCNFEI